MATRLRTFIVTWPWYVWVSLSCLVFLTVVEVGQRRFPMMASWPVTVWLMLIGLEYIAIDIVCLILACALARCLIRPFRPYLAYLEKPRSDKAKEKLADSIMSVSTAIFTATFIGLIVFPFTAFLNAMVSGSDPVSSLASFVQADGLLGWKVPILLCLFFLPAIFGGLIREKALDIYDEISRTSMPPHAPMVNSTAQGTPEQSTVPDSGPPAYVRANRGSRRRRHRPK